MIPYRLSGTLANRPVASALVNGLYLATDEDIVYHSTGSAWVERPSDIDVEGELLEIQASGKGDKVQGVLSGTIENRPAASSCTGWVYRATDEGIDYEAFPAITHQDGVFDCECDGYIEDETVCKIWGATRGLTINILSGDDLENSTYEDDGGTNDHFDIFVDDEPTAEEVAAKIVELFPSEYGSAEVINTRVRATVTADSADFLPLEEETGNTNGVLITEGILGNTGWHSISEGGAPVEVADEAARLALTGLQNGAVVYQVDTEEYYRLTDAEAPEEAESWTLIDVADESPNYLPLEAADSDGLASGLTGFDAGAIGLALDEAGSGPPMSGYYRWDGVDTIVPIDPQNGLPIEVVSSDGFTTAMAGKPEGAIAYFQVLSGQVANFKWNGVDTIKWITGTPLFGNTLTELQTFFTSFQSDANPEFSDGLSVVALDFETGFYYSWNGSELIPITNSLNALVTATTITPPQAWVSFMEQAYLGDGEIGQSVDLSADGVTHVDGLLLAGWVARAQVLGTVTLNFAGGTLNLTDVNESVRIVAVYGTSSDSLDVIGSATPTLDAGRVDGTWVITITGVPVGTIELTGFDGLEATGPITFGTDIDVSSANANTIAENLKTFIDAFIFSWVIVRVDAVLTITVSVDANLPLTAGDDSATNLTIADTPGSKSYIGQIEARGGSVTYS